MRDKLTAKQRNVLHVVEAEGPVTPADLYYHGFIASEDAARASLSRLEGRGMVEACYTHDRGSGRAYTISDKGQAALEQAFALPDERL